MKPRCGAEMTPYEAVWGALLDPVVCGRPEGHSGMHRSEQALRKERQRSIEKWPAYRQRRQAKRERIRALSKEHDELLRAQLMDAVRVAAKQAEDKAMAAREVTWGLGMSSVCGVCGKVYWSAKGHKCKGPRK